MNHHANLVIGFERNVASSAQIAEHLSRCDTHFVPALSGRVDISEYSHKIATRATRFEAWSAGTLVGLVAAYTNDPEQRTAFITSVSVLTEYTGHGVAWILMKQCVDFAMSSGMREVRLEVAKDNSPAIRLYEKCGFMVDTTAAGIVSMKRLLSSTAEEFMESKRDFNAEISDSSSHKYAYGFDFDVMHPFMIESFRPFFVKGGVLELGSFKGDFTRRLLPYFDDVTCVDGSDAAIAEARRKLGNAAAFVNSSLEELRLPRRFDNVVLTHVLEHVDDPVLILNRINNEWLAESGRLFLVCPNANAPSRQIAVKMGLISHNAAVTEAEAEHGHRRTYALDTLERDAVAAGLKVIHRSGIFFKGLANFQWDRLLQTDIISREYLDGCFKLGQQLPDLCSSIFLVCARGKRSDPSEETDDRSPAE